LTSPCLRFVLRVVPYLHVPANHRFPHISPAPLSPLIRQVSTDNFDSAMFTTDQATEHRCQGTLNGFPRQAWQGLVTILIFLICLVDVDFLFALYLNIDFHYGQTVLSYSLPGVQICQWLGSHLKLSTAAIVTKQLSSGHWFLSRGSFGMRGRSQQMWMSLLDI
jgi:hypothetical protein